MKQQLLFSFVYFQLIHSCQKRQQLPAANKLKNIK